MSNLYCTTKRESERIGGFINWCAAAGIIADADLNGAGGDTITEVKANVLANDMPASSKSLVTVLNKALDRGISLGLWSETHGVTTVAGLVALTDASTTFKHGLFQ